MIKMNDVARIRNQRVKHTSTEEKGQHVNLNDKRIKVSE